MRCRVIARAKLSGVMAGSNRTSCSSVIFSPNGPLRRSGVIWLAFTMSSQQILFEGKLAILRFLENVRLHIDGVIPNGEGDLAHLIRRRAVDDPPQGPPANAAAAATSRPSAAPRRSAAAWAARPGCSTKLLTVSSDFHLHLRLQQLFLQREIHLLQAGLQILQGVHRLIDDDDAQCRRRRFAGAIGHQEANAGFLAGQVFAFLGLHFDLEVVLAAARKRCGYRG